MESNGDGVKEDLQQRLGTASVSAPLQHSDHPHMAKFIHLMVRVLDLAKSIDFYQRAFALEENHRLDFPEFTLVYLRNPANDVEVELTLNKGRSTPYEHGDGYGHIAFVVDDLDAEHARFKQESLRPEKIKEFAPNGNKLARFFFVEDPDGYRIEVLERHGHYR